MPATERFDQIINRPVHPGNNIVNVYLPKKSWKFNVMKNDRNKKKKIHETACAVADSTFIIN